MLNFKKNLFKLIIFVTYVTLLALEIINSAIEILCNKITKEYDAEIKKIKDLGSGAVFVILITLIILIVTALF
ncbi:diacylglycerol kinase [Candidatus Pelagibacter sp. HIMB1495]|uniref:diacylglycerol kinase n=1 Tax=unclassified Candidatus Pelagibacter TaxID=2647897 RepID=UPI003F84386D